MVSDEIAACEMHQRTRYNLRLNSCVATTSEFCCYTSQYPVKVVGYRLRPLAGPESGKESRYETHFRLSRSPRSRLVRPRQVSYSHSSFDRALIALAA